MSTQSLKGYNGDDLVPINKNSKERKKQKARTAILECDEFERCIPFMSLSVLLYYYIGVNPKIG